MRRQFESRIQDLLMEIESLRNKMSNSEHVIISPVSIIMSTQGDETMKDEEIAYLTEQLKALEASSSDMVSRAQVCCCGEH